MKKILLTLSFAFVSAGLMAQSCTPDASITVSGTYPDMLPDGDAGQYYEEVVQFRIPADTNVDFNGNMVNAIIDSIKVIDVQNMPSGLSYACSPNTCALPGGQTSCGVMYGTIGASEQGTYVFQIPVVIYVRIGGAFPYQQPDTIYGLSMNVNSPTSSTKIFEEQLLVYPNPSVNKLNVALTFHAGQAEVSLFDRQGKKVEVDINRHDNILELNTSLLAPGMYYGTVKRGDSVYRFHFIRN